MKLKNISKNKIIYIVASIVITLAILSTIMITSANSEGASGPSMSPYASNETISGIILPGDKDKIALIPKSAPSTYTTYPATEVGLKEAMYKMFVLNNQDDYTIYLGATINAGTSSSTHIGRKVSPTVVLPTDITFTSLEGKISSLTLVGSYTDPLNSTNVSVSDANALNLNTDVFFSTKTSFRNIGYSMHTIFAQGHELTLDRGSVGTHSTYYYGGTDLYSIIANPIMNFYSTSTNNGIRIFGGNKTSGTVSGNITINIYNTTAGIDKIAGGGEGTAASPVRVIGNISTTIHETNGPLSGFYGGPLYGNVHGKINNLIYGKGKAGSVSYGAHIVGGAIAGNIGLEGYKGDVITTNVDTTLYTDGRFQFIGGNQESGIIYGNIVNTVSAGTYNKGSMFSISGGTGYDGFTKQSNVELYLPNPQTATAEEVKNAFINGNFSVLFKVYGNITNDIKGGSVGAPDFRGHLRAAGYVGYIEGDVYTEIGKDRLAYSDNKITENIDQNNQNNHRGIDTHWDIVGAGSVEGLGEKIILVIGNTDVIMHNVFARYTYASGFSGYQYGNSTITLNNGIVDTLEGSGRSMFYHWGNSSAIVNNGQVDWFLTGGGWENLNIYGNASAAVYDGTINASLGASYGISDNNIIYGNSDILIKGGDFSGPPRTGPNGIAGGITNVGALHGNAKVTLDLRGVRPGGFKLPKDSFISAGRPFNSNTQLGSSENNTVELNIFTDPGSNLLNDAVIYGDAGGNANRILAKHITINVEAPDSVIKTIYTTNYNNVVDNKISKNVNINIAALKSIGTLSGGSSGDNFTNPIVNASVNDVTINITTPLDKEVGKIGFGSGIINFTKINIDHTILVAEGIGSLLNGRQANAADHGKTYSDFGDVTIKNGGGFGISPVSIVSVGNVFLEGEVSFTTPSGDGKFNLTSMDFNNDTAHINWINNNLNAVSGTGTWFGQQNTLFQAFTFTPNVKNAEVIKPWLLTGKSLSGEYYIGDNDVITSSTRGYGVVIPAIRFDFKVVGGQGSVSHNVENTQEDPTNIPPTLFGFSSVPKDTLVSGGWLIVPLNKVHDLNPQITFTPDPYFGSWVKEINIRGEDTYHSTVLEQTHSNPYAWSPQYTNTTTAYEINGLFTDAPEVFAKNMLITEKRATEITSKQDIMDYQNAKGRPFFNHDISDEEYNKIIQPLSADEAYRVHDITYSAGEGSRKITKVAKLFIVPDDTAIDSISNPEYAVWAKDTMMTVTQAQALVDKKDLDKNYTGAFGINVTTGLEQEPEIASNIVSLIQSATSPTMVPVKYTMPSVSKDVEVHIVADKPELLSTPDLDFGQFKITGKRARVSLAVPATVQIKDERPGNAPWSLNLQTTDFTYSDGVNTYTIDGTNLVFVETDGTTHSLKGGHIVATGTSGPMPTSVVWPVGKTNGILFESLGTEKIGSYNADLTWTLQFVP